MTKGLNSNHLKLIAIIAMTIDHIADLIYPGFSSEPFSILFHIIGRLTAPMMWFFICEGYYHTRNPKKYILRLFLFAVISHFAYCFVPGRRLYAYTGALQVRTEEHTESRLKTKSLSSA